jgi:hypothetical protein
LQLERERLKLEARIEDMKSASAEEASHSGRVAQLMGDIASKDACISDVWLGSICDIDGPKTFAMLARPQSILACCSMMFINNTCQTRAHPCCFVMQVFFLRQLQGKLESCTAELVETQAKLQRTVADAAMSAGAQELMQASNEETEEDSDGLLQRIAQVQIYSAFLGVYMYQCWCWPRSECPSRSHVRFHDMQKLPLDALFSCVLRQA